jgi:hypothetical protein
MAHKFGEIKMTKYNLPVEYDKLDWRERRAVREQYIKEQEGNCQHCNIHLEEKPLAHRPVTPKLYPKGFFDNPIHLHHDHNTGLTIGAVHAYCNAVLWEYYGI